jgi:hypothetical protein
MAEKEKAATAQEERQEAGGEDLDILFCLLLQF